MSDIELPWADAPDWAIAAAMDDVIDRMALAIWGQFGGGRENCRAAATDALRAVHDTHRLVAVDPTHEQWTALRPWCAQSQIDEAYDAIIDAAPDYTEHGDG